MASIRESTPPSPSSHITTYPPPSPIHPHPTLPDDDDDDDSPPPPPAVVDPTPPAGYTPALALRLSFLSRVGLSFSELGGARRRNFVISTAFSLAQIITFIILLALSHKQPCDQPLRTYLILMIVRHTAGLPLSIYTVLVPPRPSRRDPPERAQELEASRRLGSSLIDHRVHRLAELANLASLVFFVLGNFWFIGSKTCRATSPELYWGSLTALVISWLFLAEILLLIIAVIFFLPLLLIAMRLFGWGEAKNEVGPLSKTDIHKLPLRVYLGPPKDATPPATIDPPPISTSTSSSSSPPPNSTTTTGKSSRSFWRLWKSRDKVSTTKGGRGDASSSDDGRPPHVNPPPGTAWIELPDNLASCAICLCDYELPPRVGDANVAEWLKEDPLRLLPCGHCFHSECSDSWLIVSGRCPVCQRPVKGDGKKKGRKGSGTGSGTGTGTGATGAIGGGGGGGGGGGAGAGTNGNREAAENNV